MEKSVINDILGKLFSEESLSPAENEMLQRWITENRSEYERLDRFIRSVEKEKSFAVDTDKAWDSLTNKRAAVAEKNIFRLYPRKIAAAVLAACFFIGVYLWTTFHYETSQIVVDTMSIKTVTLPDHSVITLNKNSSIQYDEREFARHRHVVLRGEAFFEVAPDENHPFEVSAPSINVKVLGTSFNINARVPEDIRVDVKTGRVEVTAGAENVVLKGGEGASWQNNRLKKYAISNLNYLSWKERRLTFADTPLSEAISMMEEYYGIRIRAKEDIGEYRVTTVFTSESAEQALDELKLLLHFDYKKENDVYVIYNFQPIR